MLVSMSRRMLWREVMRLRESQRRIFLDDWVNVGAVGRCRMGGGYRNRT